MLPRLLQFVVGGFLRRTWLVALAAVIACSAFAARAVAAYIEADQLAPAAHGVDLPPRKAPAPVTGRPPSGDAFVERNMFCSSCVRGPGPGPAAGFSGAQAVLIATSIGLDARATVRVVSTEVQGSWAIGEWIPGVGRIEEIGFARIEVVDHDDHRRTISLLDEAAGREGPGTAMPKSPGPPPFPGVTKINDTTYEVDRDLVRELVRGAASPGGARVQPILDANGDVKGVKVLGARNGSVAAAVGLKSGDVIAAIDGDPLKNVQQLLDLFAKLDQLTSVELSGTRAGKPLGLTLRLR